MSIFDWIDATNKNLPAKLGLMIEGRKFQHDNSLKTVVKVVREAREKDIYLRFL